MLEAHGSECEVMPSQSGAKEYKMNCNFEKYRVGDIVFVSKTAVLCAEVPFVWPIAYDRFRVTGYANWILPLPEDLVTLVRWRLSSPNKRSASGASTDPTVFIQHLMRSTKSSTWGSLENKLGIESLQLRQYFFAIPKDESEAEKKRSYELRWISMKSLKVMILASSLKNRTRHGKSTLPTVDIYPRPSCRPLRPTETGTMLRVLDQDELYARLGSKWKLHIRDRRKRNQYPEFGDLPWLVKKAEIIACELWDKHSGFEKRCIAKAARVKALPDWTKNSAGE